jgi:hypothetical protein
VKPLAALSEETQLRRFQVVAPFVQVRVPAGLVPVGFSRGAWRISGFKQDHILTEDQIHPDDLAHLLRTTITVRVTRDGGVMKEQRPMLVELPAG